MIRIIIYGPKFQESYPARSGSSIIEPQPRYGPYDQVQWQFELNLSQKFNILFHV